MIKTDNPIEVLDDMLSTGEDIWEAAVTIGMSTEESMTIQRWIQGDACLRVETQYGESTIAKFAAAIAMNTSTLKQRKTMSAYYPKDTRVSFPSLGYSHYRAAMRLGDIDKSLWALSKADDKQWPVFRFEELLKRLQGKRRGVDTIEGQVSGWTFSGGKFCLIVKLDTEDIQKRWEGQQVTIRAK